MPEGGSIKWETGDGHPSKVKVHAIPTVEVVVAVIWLAAHLHQQLSDTNQNRSQQCSGRLTNTEEPAVAGCLETEYMDQAH